MGGLQHLGTESISWLSQSWYKKRSNFLEKMLPLKTSQELLALKNGRCPLVGKIFSRDWASEQ